MKSILDYRPVNDDIVATSGAEPSLRDLVYRYYVLHLDDEAEAAELARDYCEQIEYIEKTRAHNLNNDIDHQIITWGSDGGREPE